MGLKFVWALALFLLSCKAQKASSEEEKTYVIIDGEHVELVSDEFGNQYLKQDASGSVLYIPFPFETEEETDSLRIYQAKIK